MRADFEGGARSSDFGPLLLRGVEQQCGLIGCLARAIHDGRHLSYIEHSIADLLRQRTPVAMSTAMTPTACAATLCSSWRWGAPLDETTALPTPSAADQARYQRMHEWFFALLERWARFWAR